MCLIQRISRVKQSGVSLIMALILLALLVTTVSWVSVRTHYALKRSALINSLDTAYRYADGGLRYAAWVLQQDIATNDFDAPDELWTTKAQFPIPEGEVRGQIEDIGARFNLANVMLASTSEIDTLLRLGKLLSIDEKKIRTLVRVMQKAPISEADEALLLAHFSADEMALITPYLVYLPTNTVKINLNFVSAPVFAAYLDIDLPAAQKLLQPLQQKPLKTEADWQQFILQKSFSATDRQLLNSRFSRTSQYFLLKTEVQLADVNVSATEWVWRNSLTIEILKRYRE